MGRGVMADGRLLFLVSLFPLRSSASGDGLGLGSAGLGVRPLYISSYVVSLNRTGIICHELSVLHPL